jgi:hypothetical protein
MAPRKISPTDATGVATAGLARDLVDQMLNRYVAWRERAAAAGEAYAQWCAARSTEEASRFVAYMAALGLEESAAGSYAVAVADVERLLHRGGPA